VVEAPFGVLVVGIGACGDLNDLCNGTVTDEHHRQERERETASRLTYGAAAGAWVGFLKPADAAAASGDGLEGTHAGEALQDKQ
jgi:hypothetical protein